MNHYKLRNLNSKPTVNYKVRYEASMFSKWRALRISDIYYADIYLPSKCTYQHLETLKQPPETQHQLTWMREGPSVHQAIAHWPSP